MEELRMKTILYNNQEINQNQFFEDVILECFTSAMTSTFCKPYNTLTHEERNKVNQTFFDLLSTNNVEFDLQTVYQFNINYPNSVITQNDLLKMFLYKEDRRKFSTALNVLQDLISERITIAKFNDFGFPIVIQTVLKHIEVSSYAQYQYALKLIHRPKRKRTDFKSTILPNEKLIVFKGWHDISTNDMVTISENEMVKVQQSRYCSFDENFLTDITKSTNLKPLITL